MNRKNRPPVPEAIVQLQRQLDHFRSSQPQRTKLPEALWEAAVELARRHGMYRVAHPLRLEETGEAQRINQMRISGKCMMGGDPWRAEIVQEAVAVLTDSVGSLLLKIGIVAGCWRVQTVRPLVACRECVVQSVCSS